MAISIFGQLKMLTLSIPDFPVRASLFIIRHNVMELTRRRYPLFDSSRRLRRNFELQNFTVPSPSSLRLDTGLSSTAKEIWTSVYHIALILPFDDAN